MNRIDTTQIVDPSVQQPFTGRSLYFLQNSSLNQYYAIARGLIGEDLYAYQGLGNGGVVIAGCVVSGNDIGEGFIIWLNEIYYFPGQVGAYAFAPTGVMSIATTNDAYADPVTFSDNTVKNIHNVKQFVCAAGVSGTTIFDLVELINPTTYFLTPGLTAGYTTYGGKTPQYHLLRQRLSIKGQVQYTWPGVPVLTIFTLPVGYRPTTTKQMVAQGYNLTAGGYFTLDLTINSSTGTVGYTSHVNITLADVIVIYLDEINIQLNW